MSCKLSPTFHVELSTSDLLSGNFKTLQEAMLCRHILGKIDVGHSRVHGVTSEED
ncbi:hypothetical protein I79_009731 [Cricetulus griseus]|uniref:Uncharacterized protein n=1 Tax=Cricetulus griseus TaxID=10029 RepID=G3HGJ3_CRIGR|nr:hypothetical protein I79_009731 [Cricetulus griseus]